METKAPEIKQSGNAFLEKVEKLAMWQRVAILVGVICLMGVASYFLLIEEKLDEVVRLEGVLQGLEKDLAASRAKAAELPKWQAKMEETEAQFKIAMRALPEKEEIPSLLTNVSKSGQEVGLEFLLFEPKAEVKREFYAEIPVAMNIRGDYHNLATFFDKVARLSRIVNINNITINRGKEIRDLSTSCTAVTYKFIEPPPEKPAAPRPAAVGANPDPGKSGDAKPKKNPRKLNF